MPSDDEPAPTPGRMFTATRPPETALGEGTLAPAEPLFADPDDAPDDGDAHPAAPPHDTPVAPQQQTPHDETPRDETPHHETPRDGAPDDETPRYDAPRDEPPRYETSHDEEALRQAAGEIATAADLEPEPTAAASRPTDDADALWGAADAVAAEDQREVASPGEPDDDALVLPEWEIPWTLEEDMSGLTAQLEQLVEEDLEEDQHPAGDEPDEPVHAQVDETRQPDEPDHHAQLDETRQPDEPDEPPAATRPQPTSQPALRPPLAVQPVSQPPVPPPTRVHERRIDQRPGPIRMTPSEALALVREGPGALRRGPRAR